MSSAPTPSPVDRDDVIDEVQAELATLRGIANATDARTTELVARSLRDGLWAQPGVMTVEHWAAWQCGLSPTRAKQVVAAARRWDELPATMALFTQGLLSADQVAAIVRHAPSCKDSEVAEFAVHATVSQLRRTLAGYGWGKDKPERSREEHRRCSFGATDDSGQTWRLTVEAPADEGAVVETALKAKYRQLVSEAADVDTRHAITMYDAFLALIEEGVAAEDDRVLGRRKRYVVNIHQEVDIDGEPSGRLHLGPLLSSEMRRYLTCDASVRTIFEHLGLPVSVGRAQYTIPDRTRLVVEHRDQGCRVHGCSVTRVEVHHIVHWEDGGLTSTFNLVCLCPRHHRLHHLGMLGITGITGNADDPHGLTFTNQHGHPIRPAGCTHPPNAPPGPAATRARVPWQPYLHGTGERLDPTAVWFGPETNN